MRAFTGRKLLVATHNAGKLDEMRAMFAPLGVEIVGAAEFGLPEPEETETSFVGNARIKARAAMEMTGLPVLADDSGITVDGLDGAPGVHTADWAATPGGRDFMQAMARTWAELDARAVPEPRRAQFRATLLMIWPDGHEEIFEGVAPGRLVWPPRGALGHGYDPIFVPDGHDRTYAEMTPDEKNAISHRAQAFGRLKEAFSGRISTGSPFEAAMGYSRAVVRGGWCFVSGVTGYDYATMTMPDTAADQARGCFATIAAVLSEAGFAMNDIVRVQYTVTDHVHIDQIAPVLAEILGDIRPAATMVIAGLIRPEMKVEIEVTAMKA